MSKYTLLANDQHASLKVKRQHGAEFGDGVNQAMVFPSEFADLHREYPIFFRRGADGELFSIVLMGIDRGQNLFLNGSSWNARYVPALHRKGPFQIALPDGEGQDAKVQIDLGDPRVTKAEGEPLFLQHGGLSPYLKYMIDVLQRIQSGAASVKPMFAALNALSLIEPVTLQLKVSETETYTVPDLFGIDEKRFGELSGDELKSMHDSGLLALCYWILSSRTNANRLIELKLTQDQAG